jgi:hypothetical protein
VITEQLLVSADRAHNCQIVHIWQCIDERVDRLIDLDDLDDLS